MRGGLMWGEVLERVLRDREIRSLLRIWGRHYVGVCGTRYVFGIDKFWGAGAHENWVGVAKA